MKWITTGCSKIHPSITIYSAIFVKCTMILNFHGDRLKISLKYFFVKSIDRINYNCTKRTNLKDLNKSLLKGVGTDKRCHPTIETRKCKLFVRIIQFS